MTTEPPTLRDQDFRHRSLRGTSFHDCDLAGVVVRGSDVNGMEVDSPWLVEEGGAFRVNGVDVVAYVDAELDRRFPGRGLRRATDPAGLREAWSALERSWAATLARAAAMPSGTVDASVAGEWSLAQTLRHLVMATDLWFGRAVLGRDEPFHPVGLPHDDGGEGSPAYDASVFSAQSPSYDEVLEARADRQRMVRDHLAVVTADDLTTACANPHAPEHAETVLSCLHTVLEEEWEHHRYAVRDLDQLEAQP
jgi:hypothetical protein